MSDTSSGEYQPPDDFPVLIMGVLSTACFASAISISNLFPYIGFMVIDMGLAKDANSAGNYAGFIASAMMLGRFFSSYYWGKRADRIGRKPVLMTGLVAVITMSLSFGFSMNIWLALLSRFLLGLWNPTWGIAKTLVSELVAPKFTARAMGLTTGCWSLGLVVGPALGGLLANPVKLYPTVFGSFKILKKFPYLLPNFVTALFGILGLVLVYFYLPETLRKIADEEMAAQATGAEGLTNLVDKESKFIIASSSEEKSSGATIRELISTEGVFTGVLAYFVLSFVSIIYDEILPLWLMATRDRGGLDIEQVRIGQIMSVVGAVLLAYTFCIYPVLQERLGTTKAGFRVGMIAAFPLLFFTTALNIIPLHSTLQLPATIIMVSFTKMCTFLAFSSIGLLLNDTVPRGKRASLNGFAMCIGSFAKSLGPWMGSILFAWSINNNLSFPFDCHLVFISIASLSILSAFIPLTVKPSIAGSKVEGNRKNKVEVELSSFPNENMTEVNISSSGGKKSSEGIAIGKPQLYFPRTIGSHYSRLPAQEESVDDLNI